MPTSIRLIDALRSGVPLVIALGAFTVAAQAADLQEVTVTVPAVKTIGRDATGAPIQQVSASARVKYNSLMLTTNSGRALLQYKVTEVAQKLCREINTVAATPTDDDGSCVQRAVAGAKVQIAAAAVAQNTG
jgi:UrcA family protein